MNANRLLRQINSRQLSTIRQETGQSIVLIALALVAIIGFMGIALDVGFIFARGSQLQAAIDAAALAGVTELVGWSSNSTGSEDDARTRSAQFLNANGMPISVTLSLNNAANLHVEQTPLGATQYAITATWPVETFFLKVIGFREPINLSRSATAAVFSLANVYASRRIEDGIITTSSQGMFGPDICTSFGDPYSPRTSPWRPNPPDLYTWKYRIMIPPDYEQTTGSSIVRVELLDPDSINAPNSGSAVTIPRTNAAAPYIGTQTTGSCTTNQRNPCLIPTLELTLGPPPSGNGTLPLDRINPWWFLRLDENRQRTSATSCGEPGTYDATKNTQTFFELYYWRQNGDGTIARQDLANYTGQVGDGSRDNGGHLTDMQWVSPGAIQSYDYPGNRANGVPFDPGSPGNFEIDLASETTNILVEQGSGLRYLNLDVTNISGASENGFELWAGPPTYIDTVPGQANPRNLHALNFPGSHSSKGATVFGSGTLPMNSDYADRVDIPLIYVGPEMAGQEISVSLFDSDSGAAPPVIFFFDSIAQEDWSFTFAQSGVPDPDGGTGRCIPGDGCNNRWVDPPYRIIVPGGDPENCDYGNPQGDPDCVPFYGGRLTASYDGGLNDSYSWQISIPGLPYLVR